MLTGGTVRGTRGEWREVHRRISRFPRCGRVWGAVLLCTSLHSPCVTRTVPTHDRLLSLSLYTFTNHFTSYFTLYTLYIYLILDTLHFHLYFRIYFHLTFHFPLHYTLSLYVLHLTSRASRPARERRRFAPAFYRFCIGMETPRGHR